MRDPALPMPMRRAGAAAVMEELIGETAISVDLATALDTAAVTDSLGRQVALLDHLSALADEEGDDAEARAMADMADETDLTRQMMRLTALVAAWVEAPPDLTPPARYRMDEARDLAGRFRRTGMMAWTIGRLIDALEGDFNAEP